MAVQKFDHPYCNYDVPSQIQPRSTANVQQPNKKSRAGSGKLKFGVEPELNLDFNVTAGPLGLAYPKASARAAFLADVEINNVLTIDSTLEIIDIAAELRAGLRPDEELCGIDPGESRVQIFEVNLLPADFLDDLRIPGDASRKSCLDAVKKFQDLVDRAKKAFFDARTLIKEYYRRYDIDPTNPLNRQTFPGPTAANPDIPSLCELIVKEPPPAGFDAASPNCHDEAPEDTINRFIRFYNREVANLVNQGVGTVADAIDRSLADAIGDDKNEAGDGLEWKFPIAKLHDLEEIVIVNQTFMVGPIPVLLQVLFTVEYGFQLDAKVALRVGSALRMALSWDAQDMQGPVAKAGLSGSPYAQAGIGLFVGIGFDIGIASASVGIQGNLTLGRISLPVHAGAGITLNAVDDRRTEEMELPSYLQELADISPLRLSFPMRKFSFGLQFQYGADLVLENILSGSIDLRVRVKFFFFSKTWRKNIVRFPGLDKIEFTLFAGKADTKGAKWGTVEMPMPFVQLSEIEVREPVKDSQPEWHDYAHEQFLFDSQCDCIKTFENVTDPVEQSELRSCARNADCCDKDQTNPPIVCFQDPAVSDKGKCTACRAPGSWGPVLEFSIGDPTPGQTCAEDEDCCSGRCLPKDIVTGQASTEKVCMPISYCEWGGGPCDSNDDCGGPGSVCGGNNLCSVCNP
jgi:hypothetical protein